jgi:nucleoside-diphosphate-sugar epimerase
MNYTIIGNGQLAKAFKNFEINDVCVFASGVSNSNCTDKVEFERERKLLVETLKNNGTKKIIYFSSCALSAEEYFKNRYYEHKQNMEKIIKEYSSNYYIFRIPQLFGDLFLHNTLVNFIYKSIENNHKFNVYSEAYRYVIEINDVRKIVKAYLVYHDNCITIDIANFYRYKVLDIVKIFEKLLNKNANYEIVEKEDKYILDLTALELFIKKYEIDISFGKEYLTNKLKEKL